MLFCYQVRLVMLTVIIHVDVGANLILLNFLLHSQVFGDAGKS